MKKRVAKKVMHDIHHEVDKIEMEQSQQKAAGKYMLIIIVLITAGMVFGVFSSNFFQFISTLIE